MYSIIEISIVSSYVKHYKKWHIGRVPPSRFEYDKLNGYYSTKHAKQICENDPQCGGFTFKGTKQDKEKKSVYFFHFINVEDSYINYPHWTFYIPNRTYVVISGKYLPDSDEIVPAINVPYW